MAVRFAAFPALQIFALVAMAWGGWWTWVPGTALFLALVLGDSCGGDTDGKTGRLHPAFFESVVWLSVLLTVPLSAGLLTYTAAPGSRFDAIGLALRGPDSPAAILGAISSTGIILGISTAASHEFIHRRLSPAWYAAQAALAQLFYTPISIEHVFGHHRNVGFPNDVTTAPRGMGFWRYLARAVHGTYANAFRIEAQRLAATGSTPLTLRNRAVQGMLVQAIFAALLLWGGGITGLAGALIAAGLAILSVETSQYVSHYGVVRIPGRPFEERHAWNGHRAISTSLMFNIQRHSAHHRSAMRPFWSLDPCTSAPSYPLGVSVMGVVALVPPIFMRLTDPLLEDWEGRLASPEERTLLAKRRGSTSHPPKPVETRRPEGQPSPRAPGNDAPIVLQRN